MSQIIHPQISNIGAVIQIPDRQDIGDFNTSGSWTALNADTGSAGNSNNHVLGAQSLEFDKVDGAPGGVLAMMWDAIAEMDLRRFKQEARILAAVHIPDLADVKNAFIRLGSDISNYSQWTFPDTGLTAGAWHLLDKKLHEVDVVATGKGLNFAALTYVAVGLEFDLETNALANIQWDHLQIVS